MLAKINSCAVIGLDCEKVEVETDISNDLSKFIIVGLPDAAIQEAKERVALAIKNSGLSFPRHKVTVNLAPADIKKEGPAYDLPIAASILQSTDQLNADLQDSLFVGELALDGRLRHINGILSVAAYARENNFRKLFLPESNAAEAALIPDLEIYPVPDLSRLYEHCNNIKLIEPYNRNDLKLDLEDQFFDTDMAHVKGQEQVKRAVEIAAAGAHNILLSGPPGSGKTLIARTLPSILPQMTEKEILEVTKIYSIAGLLPHNSPIIKTRPFRSPHHSSSGVSLVGGGKFPRPGEISLAHRGILFLDEFPEFPRIVLENLRQPLEDGVISISRAQGTLTFPAKFTLVASQNPCPCGYASDPDKDCTCTSSQILKYQKKISGPILDRIDLHVEVPRVEFDKLQSDFTSENSEQIRQRVQRSREIQLRRFEELPVKFNSEMRSQDVKRFCEPDSQSIDLLRNAVRQMHLSARAYHRILKLSRTIADLDNDDNIRLQHVAEALQYREKII